MAEHPDDDAARKGRRREILFGAVTVVSAAAFALLVIPDGVTTPASVVHLPLSPAFLPYVLTIGVGLFAAIHFLEAIFAPHMPADDEDRGGGLHARWKSRGLILSLLLLTYLLLPERLGMLTTAIIVTIALLAIGGERRPLILLGVGISVPLLVYLFFVHVAQVPMPTGLFEDWM